MEVTNDLVFKVLNWLDIKYINTEEDFIQLKTVCHGGDSNKLYFYKNSNKLVCFTHCGTMNIFELIAKVKNISDKEAFKIVINNFNVNIQSKESLIVNPAKKFKRKKEEFKQLDPIDENLLNCFYDFGIEKWKKENINYQTQGKFEIKYSIANNAIIIPHRDTDGNLVGIRQRNLNKELVDAGVKYVPTYVKNQLLNYPTSNNLYGYYYNKEEIKKTRKIVLFEAEKSVMQMDSFYNDNNYSVALSGHNLSRMQILFLYKLPIDEIIIGFDKDFHEEDLKTIEAMQQMIIKKYSVLTNRFNVSILWDENNLLNYKDSPTDQGKEVFKQLMKERQYLQ